jgi:hypothetical protein
MQRDRDQRLIQVETAVVDRMRAIRRPGERYSEVILRLFTAEKSAKPRKATRARSAPSSLRRKQFAARLASLVMRVRATRGLLRRKSPAGEPERFGSRRRLESRVHRLASIVDADRARLGAVGQRRQQVGQLGVAVLGQQPLRVVTPAPAAGSQTIASVGPRKSDRIREPSWGVRSPAAAALRRDRASERTRRRKRLPRRSPAQDGGPRLRRKLRMGPIFSPSLCAACVQPSRASGKSLPLRNTAHSALAAVAIWR